jgi:hypothetical protein
VIIADEARKLAESRVVSRVCALHHRQARQDHQDHPSPLWSQLRSVARPFATGCETHLRRHVTQRLASSSAISHKKNASGAQSHKGTLGSIIWRNKAWCANALVALHVFRTRTQSHARSFVDTTSTCEFVLEMTAFYGHSSPHNKSLSRRSKHARFSNLSL